MSSNLMDDRFAELGRSSNAVACSSRDIGVDAVFIGRSGAFCCRLGLRPLFLGTFLGVAAAGADSNCLRELCVPKIVWLRRTGLVSAESESESEASNLFRSGMCFIPGSVSFLPPDPLTSWVARFFGGIRKHSREVGQSSCEGDFARRQLEINE